MRETMLEEQLTNIEKQVGDIESLCQLFTVATAQNFYEPKAFDGAINILYANIQSLHNQITDLKKLYTIE